MALEAPPPLMANAILNFHFDFPHTSLRVTHSLDVITLGGEMQTLMASSTLKP